MTLGTRKAPPLAKRRSAVGGGGRLWVADIGGGRRLSAAVVTGMRNRRRGKRRARASADEGCDGLGRLSPGVERRLQRSDGHGARAALQGLRAARAPWPATIPIGGDLAGVGVGPAPGGRGAARRFDWCRSSSALGEPRARGPGAAAAPVDGDERLGWGDDARLDGPPARGGHASGQA
jgi:hypothetical protein